MDPTPVACVMPEPEDEADLEREPPEGYDTWKTSKTCTHEGCREADYYGRLYRSSPPPLTREERESIEADRELMADEFHGRNLDGRIEW